MTQRREFLGAAGAIALGALVPRSARAADSRIEVLVGEPASVTRLTLDLQ
jgi:hypothetical protein